MDELESTQKSIDQDALKHSPSTDSDTDSESWNNSKFNIHLVDELSPPTDELTPPPDELTPPSNDQPSDKLSPVCEAASPTTVQHSNIGGVASDGGGEEEIEEVLDYESDEFESYIEEEEGESEGEDDYLSRQSVTDYDSEERQSATECLSDLSDDRATDNEHYHGSTSTTYSNISSITHHHSNTSSITHHHSNTSSITHHHSNTSLSGITNIAMYHHGNTLLLRTTVCSFVLYKI